MKKLLFFISLCVFTACGSNENPAKRKKEIYIEIQGLLKDVDSRGKRMDQDIIQIKFINLMLETATGSKRDALLKERTELLKVGRGYVVEDSLAFVRIDALEAERTKLNK